MQIVPTPRFCHIGTKMSVLWPSKYAKIRFWPGPGPRWEAHDALPDPSVGWRGDTPPHILPHSARTHLRRSPCVPQKSSQIYTPMFCQSPSAYTLSQRTSFFSSPRSYKPVLAPKHRLNGRRNEMRISRSHSDRTFGLRDERRDEEQTNVQRNKVPF